MAQRLPLLYGPVDARTRHPKREKLARTWFFPIAHSLNAMHRLLSGAAP